MSRSIPQVTVDFFDAEVKRAYGDKRKLAGKCYEKKVTGATAYFPKKGKGMATRHNPGSDVNAMNTDFSRVQCDLLGWEAFDYADKFEANEINFAEATELAEVAGDAIGLRMDQVVIDAIEDGYNTTDAEYTVGTADATLTIATLLDGQYVLNNNGVEETERCFMHTPAQLRDLLKTTQVTSADYNTVKTLVNGEVDTFLGFEFISIAGSRLEGGLPTGEETVVATDYNYNLGFVYHKRSVGFAENMGMNSSMDWIPEKRAWLVGAEFEAGAVVIDNEGIVAVKSTLGEA